MPTNVFTSRDERPVLAARANDAVSRIARLPLSYSGVGRFVAIGEFGLIVALAVVSSILYHAVIPGGESLSNLTLVAVTAAILYCLGLQAQHLYRPSAILHPAGASQSILATWIGAFCVLLVLGFLAKVSETFSRGAVSCFFLSGIVGLPVARLVARRAFVHALAHNYLAGRRKVVVFGDRRQLSARNVVANLTRHGYNVSSQFDVSLNDGSLVESCRGIAASFERLQAFVQENKVDEIFLVFATSDQRSIDMVSARMRELPIPVRLLFDQGVSRFLADPFLDLGAAKAVKLQSGPLTEIQQGGKRVLDIIGSATGLLLLSPIMIVIAIMIRMDSPGPVIFRQRRAGFSGRTFFIYKFRSMTTLDDGAVVKQAVRGDKRVTRIGRYLRKASLDELPQLVNVLRGEMSLVGPRPHALSHDNQYNKVISTYALRYHMKPGITGWAQVNGCRGETSDLASMAARVECDLWYIVHWKVQLDIKIILMTVFQVFRPKNVY